VPLRRRAVEAAGMESVRSGIGRSLRRSREVYPAFRS
jgi:hypothetical protein